jgi:peptidoglycan/LPS O-acetylase OafA/YrhL
MPAPSITSPAAMPRRRLEFLDALRGLAAVYVVFYHMLMLPDPHLVPPRWVERLAMAGGTGVTLFFLVSAFSLYYTMPLRQRDGNPTLSFYLHRFFRIAPLFWFLIAATLVRDVLVFGVGHSAFDIAASATFLFNLLPEGQQGFVWASWTIGVEMLFYAVFPLIYARVRSLGDAIALVAACLLLWLGFQLVLDYLVLPAAWEASMLQWSVLKHLPIFAMGIVVFHVFMRFDATALDGGAYRSTGNALLWVGALGYAALLQGWLPDVFGNAYYWQGVVYGVLFLGLAMAPWRALVNGATRFLGKVSYSIYLNHPTCVYLLIPVYRWIYARSPSLTLSFLACVAVTFAVLLPLSWLTYRFIEEPGIEWGKKVMKRINARRAPQAMRPAEEVAP